MNDYTGKLLHDAHYNDLLTEASGGWRLKEARQPKEFSGGWTGKPQAGHEACRGRHGCTACRADDHVELRAAHSSVD